MLNNKFQVFSNFLLYNLTHNSKKQLWATLVLSDMYRVSNKEACA